MNMTEISAIIPCYNDSEYVVDAIESVLNQTKIPDEVIVIDDGSTDELKKIIGDYIANNDINLIEHEENKGLPAARNTGIKAANGRYIALLDADDRWLPKKIEVQTAALQQDASLGMVFSDHYRVTPDDEVIIVRRADDPPEEEFLEKAFVRGIGGILPSAVLIRRECFTRVGYFDEELRLAQELEMWMRIGAEYRLKRIPKPLVRRRVRDDSLASDKFDKLEYRERIITPKMIDLYPRLAPLVPKRNAHLTYLRATYHVSNGEIAEARRLLLRSIYMNPRAWKPYVRLFTTFFGSQGAQFLFNTLQKAKFRMKDLRHRLSSFSHRSSDKS